MLSSGLTRALVRLPVLQTTAPLWLQLQAGTTAASSCSRLLMTEAAAQTTAEDKKMGGSASMHSNATTAATALEVDVAVSTKGAGASSTSSVPPHHVPNPGAFGPRYQNPWSTYEERSLKDVYKWHRDEGRAGAPKATLSSTRTPSEQDWKAVFPLHPVDFESLYATPAATGAISACWVGHATVMANMAGLTFITDPCFSPRCSPFQFLGPSRVVPPPFEIEDPKLKSLDFVLISHNHYDHLDQGSVKRLHKRFGDKLRWYVPLGVGSWFRSNGVSNFVEMDWWQEAQHPGSDVKVAMVPAQHWSARGIFDRFKTLWGGYIVQGPSSKFWFTGDTGYCPVFKEIGERYGPIDLSAIPIGAYEPRWFMWPQHVNPEEAVAIHRDVRSCYSLAIHHGTWCLTDEAMDEPAVKLGQVLAKEGLDPDCFLAPQHGEMMRVEGRKLQGMPKRLGAGQ